MGRSIKDVRTNEEFRKIIIQSLSNGLGYNKKKFIDILEYVIDNKLHLFDIEEFEGFMYEEEDLLSDLILPSVRRVFGEVFFNPPTLFKDKRLEYFQLLFDIDEFIDYFIEIVPNMKKSLELLVHLDRGSKTLELIVDNYIASLVENTKNREDILADIRDLRISKTLIK